MKKIVISAAIAAAMIAIPAQAKSSKAPKCVTPTTAQVESLFADFNNAWASKNPDTVTALFAKDAVLLATVSNTPRLNHAEIRDYFVGFLKPSPVGTINTSTVKTGCNTAARLGTWTVTVTDAATGAKTDIKARYSFIYTMEGGKWKIAHLHSSMMPEKTS
jgi:uncharacterized protein (TIGR02246 family)